MAKQRRIIVRGKQRKDIDPAVLAQVLVAIAKEWQLPPAETASPDVFDAAIEDHGAGAGTPA